MASGYEHMDGSEPCQDGTVWVHYIYICIYICLCLEKTKCVHDGKMMVQYVQSPGLGFLGGHDIFGPRLNKLKQPQIIILPPEASTAVTGDDVTLP